jgi:hypothetical protein
VIFKELGLILAAVPYRYLVFSEVASSNIHVVRAESKKELLELQLAVETQYGT